MNDSEPFQRASAAALRYLSHRPRSEAEVRTRLARRFPPNVVDSVMEELSLRGLTDDSKLPLCGPTAAPATALAAHSQSAGNSQPRASPRAGRLRRPGTSTTGTQPIRRAPNMPAAGRLPTTPSSAAACGATCAAGASARPSAAPSSLTYGTRGAAREARLRSSARRAEGPGTQGSSTPWE